jgi:hypothetical protein
MVDLGEKSASSTATGPEARRYPRSSDFEGRNASVELRDHSAPVFTVPGKPSLRTRRLGVEMVDMNPTGIGILLDVPLPVGTFVGVAGELFAEGSWSRFVGRARVAHCRILPDARFRVGLNFLQVQQQELGTKN